MTREVSWGDGLVVEAFKNAGGLKAAVDRIHAVVGKHVGSRSTFVKYLHVDDPASLGERDRFRAWLLIVALRQEPSDWGITDDVVPPVMAGDIPGLKEALRACRDSNPKPSDSERDAPEKAREDGAGVVVLPRRVEEREAA